MVAFRDRGGRGIGIAAAVVGGMTGMAWVWTVVLGGMAIGDEELGFLAAAITLLLALAFTGSLVGLLRWRKKARNAQVAPFLAADLQQRVLLDARGNTIASLDQCRAVKAMLISSSAPSAQIRWSGGKREVFRGSLFGGGVADVLSMLHQLGFSR